MSLYQIAGKLLGMQKSYCPIGQVCPVHIVEELPVIETKIIPRHSRPHPVHYRRAASRPHSIRPATLTTFVDQKPNDCERASAIDAAAYILTTLR